MNWDQIEGNWKQMVGKAQSNWGKITEDEWHQVQGRREELIGLVQEKYGDGRAEAERQVDDWMNKL